LFHEQIAFILDILSILGSQITRSPTFYCVCVCVDDCVCPPQPKTIIDWGKTKVQ